MISYAKYDDINDIISLDQHIDKELLRAKIKNEEVYVIRLNSNIIGTLRYSLFWDNIPFMNLLYIHKQHQKRGYGSMLTKYWEDDMALKGHSSVLTSTLSNENAQHFYRKIGYMDIGGFIIPNEPLELLFFKKLSV